jgi:hypothetical protein
MAQLFIGKVNKVYLGLQLRLHRIVCRNVSRLLAGRHRLFHLSCNDPSAARMP